MTNDNRAIAVIPSQTPALCNKTVNVSAIQRAEAGITDNVLYVSAAQIEPVAVVAPTMMKATADGAVDDDGGTDDATVIIAAVDDCIGTDADGRPP